MIYWRKMGFGITFNPQHVDDDDRAYLKLAIIPLTCRHSTSSKMTVIERKYVRNRKWVKKNVIFNTLLSITY
jgi:hypothetical protein